MHSTREGNQWSFGMKAHIGTDATQTSELLHGDEKTVFGDAGDIGADKREELAKRSLTWRIAMKRSQVTAIADAELKALTPRCERLKAQIRARVEHPFHILKNRFDDRKLRYTRLGKNTAQLHMRFALATLVIAKNALQAAP